MTSKKRPNLARTARCRECGVYADYSTPGVPDGGGLIIRHERECPHHPANLTPPDEVLSLIGQEADHVEVQDLGHGVAGHIVVQSTDHGVDRDAVFVDLGSVLHLWSYQGATLTPALARDLGKALIGWADRKNPPPFDLMVTLTDQALREFVFEVLDMAEERTIETIRLAVDDGTFKVKFDEGSWSPPLTDGVTIQEGHEIP